MTDQWMFRLSEYLDDELTSVERNQMEQHLAGCESCLRVLDELRLVVARAAVLPDREPEQDLWQGVSAAIAAGRVVPISRKSVRRFSFSLPQLAAAAAALVIMSAGAVWFTVDRGTTTLGDRPDSITVQPVANNFDRRGRADSAITELERILAEESGRLDTGTVRILSQNLALIDRAIEQARTALNSDPGNVYLNEHLARTMRKKIEVLRRAADLAAVAS